MIHPPPMQFIKLTTAYDITVYVNVNRIIEFYSNQVVKSINDTTVKFNQITLVWLVGSSTHIEAVETPEEILRLIAMTNEVPVVMDSERLAPKE